MKQNITSVSCIACGDRTPEPSKKRPHLCVSCAEAADTVEVLCGCDADARHALVVASMKTLAADDPSFRVVRRFVALLRPDVGKAIFLQPGQPVVGSFDAESSGQPIQ